MRFLSLSLAAMLLWTTSPASAYQMGSGGSGGSGGSTNPTNPTNPGGSGGSSTGGGTSAPAWGFTHPDDGMETFGDVLFLGTGPTQSLGELSVYSYTNLEPGGVYPNELQLQITAVVDTDAGTDWDGPVYSSVGDGYATIMPAANTINIALLNLVNSEHSSGLVVDVGTLTLLAGGQGVLFRILEP